MYRFSISRIITILIIIDTKIQNKCAIFNCGLLDIYRFNHAKT